MGEELDPVIIKKTQESLGKIIKKPTLTDKLLRKPPFKFLHDILTSVINSTGFLQGVYIDEELLSENIKDRESKIAFLQKAIDHVVSVTGEPLKIRPAKTIAGHEADKTNEFLQALSKAIALSNNNSISSRVIEDKSSTRSSTKKSEKKDTNELKKLDNKDKQQKSSIGESPKTSSTKSRSTDKAKQDKSLKNDLKNAERDPGKRSELKESSRKSEPESGKTRSLSKSSSHNKDSKGTEKGKIKNIESNEKERGKSRERTQNKTKSKSTSEDKNKVRRESRDIGRSSDKNTMKDSKKISKRSSPEKKVHASASPEKSPVKRAEEVDEDINDFKQANGSLEPDALLLGSEQMIIGDGESMSSEMIQKQSSSASSTIRALSGRPPTGLAPSSKNMDGVAPNSTEEHVEESTPQLGQVNEPEKEAKRPSTSTIRRASARPPTARPAAPRVRVVDAAPEDAPNQEAPKPVSNIIMDGVVAPDNDEDDGFVVEEPAALEAEDILVKNSTSVKDLEGKTHGSLVTQIIATSKDLENGSRRPGTGFKRVEVDKSLLSDTSRRKDRELFSREMDKLRESVQTLTKSANPLGKLIDYLQEDVDAMFRELETWSAERRRHEIALQMEESKTDFNLESLQNNLQEVEEKIEDQMAKISAIKANIIRNEERVQKMITATRM